MRCKQQGVRKKEIGFMATSCITLTELESFCRQAATAQTAGAGNFLPTPKQVYFFTLIWLSKKGVTWDHVEAMPDSQEVTASLERVQQVTQHLAEWGAIITRLKQKDEKEWELLRLQIEKAVRCYPYISEDLRVEAVQNALLKIFILLDKMIAWPDLEMRDIAHFVQRARGDLTNLYDFGSPFYAFAKRLARNELMTQLRKRGRQGTYSLPLDDTESTLPALIVTTSFFEEDEVSVQTFHLQLKTDMAKLLETIEHDLTPRLLQVILQTLGTRAEFWRALEVTGLSAPQGLLVDSRGMSTDTYIAETLGITENNIRVHRVHAKKRLKEVDPNLALLLEGLITTRNKIRYRPNVN
jgi:hypothetical protein